MEYSFMGRHVTSEDVNRALNEFDSVYPETADFESWLDDPRYKYAIRRGERLYPPKYILSHITNIATSEFSGGEQTNRVFQYLGFQIEYLPSRLILHQSYSRNEAHDIFAPNTVFTRQSGTWGLQGIIALPHRPKDYVFFVSFGRQQGTHQFEESITEDGVFTWQSQPKQTLHDKIVQNLITHDDTRNAIYLFLRTRPDLDYCYLGRLKYLSHDSEREKPVWFQWQILDWPIPQVVLDSIELVLTPSTSPALVDDIQRSTLIEISPPLVLQSRPGATTEQFRARKVSDRAKRDANARSLGLAGELAVLHLEIDSLSRAGRDDLAAKVIHVSVVEGDGAGYDILSYTIDGAEKYIEVKTTKGGMDSSFLVSSNEIAFSQNHPSSYYLYRVCNFNETRQSGDFYILPGDITQQVMLTPTEYRAHFR